MSSIEFSLPAALGERVRQLPDGGNICRSTRAEHYRQDEVT